MARRMGAKALRESLQNLAVQASGEKQQAGGGLGDHDQQNAGIGAGGRIDGLTRKNIRLAG